MNREFHITASDYDNCFTMLGDGVPVEFTSLFEAARHARSISGCENGIVVINDEAGRALSRIPFKIAS